METVKDIDLTFRTIVDAHEILQAFHTNSTQELDIEQIGVDKYPLLYANCSGAQINGGYVQYRYEVIVADLVIEEQTDTLVDVYSETFLLMQDVVAQFSLALSAAAEDRVNKTWSFEMPVDCQPFTSKFSNLLTGWSATFTINVPAPLNLCEAPFE